jgi:C_GCAxxG_C_C family probable redox protein
MFTGGLYCAPAVLAVLNRRLGGGLDEDLIRRLTAGLPEGMNAGCTCGALSGAQLALGLFLGGRGFDKAMAASARALHDSFKALQGSTCCRVLTRKVKGGRAGRENCAALTGHAAELACRLALAARPELAAGCPRQGEACRERPTHERALRAPVAALRRLLQKSGLRAG